MVWRMSLIPPKYDYFELTPKALEIRAKSGWGVQEGSKIKTFLDAVEAEYRAGVRVHDRKNYPTLNRQYAAWLNKEGYLRPVYDE